MSKKPPNDLLFLTSKKVLLLWLCGLFTALVHASPCVSCPTAQDPIRIPLKRVGNLFFIEAQIDDVVGNFVLDLGAPYLVLNSTYFRKYRVDESHSSGTLLSENDHVKRTWVKRFRLAGISYKNLEADVTDLSQIENRKRLKILGLLGVGIFKRYVLDLDVINKQLVLWPDRNEVAIDSKLLFDLPIQVNNNVLSVVAKSGKVTLKLSLDTGAETNILDNKLSNRVYKGMKILGTSVITDGNGSNTEVLRVVLGGLSIDGHLLKRMRTLVINLESISRAYGRKIDGMLGYPFFSSGRVLIDFRKKRLAVYQYKKRE
ncbi:MAG: pepsin/retropepsin-like aspartic protease family protein [Bacteroidota bacterium]